MSYKKNHEICALLSRIEECIVKKPKITTYSEADALGMLIILRDLGRLGRIKLSRLLNIGEQSIRSLGSLLEESGLIKKGSYGYMITNRALNLLTGINFVEKITSSKAIPWKRIGIVQVCKKVGIDNKKLLEIRDNTVVWGGYGSITLLIDERGEVRLPGGEGTSLEKEIIEEIENHYLSCEGVIGILGIRNEVGPWGPLYGFLEALCK